MYIYIYIYLNSYYGSYYAFKVHSLIKGFGKAPGAEEAVGLGLQGLALKGLGV